jgi:hypothetical protein
MHIQQLALIPDLKKYIPVYWNMEYWKLCKDIKLQYMFFTLDFRSTCLKLKAILSYEECQGKYILYNVRKCFLPNVVACLQQQALVATLHAM